MHGHESLTGLAIVVLAALVCGMVMTRLKQPAVVGYTRAFVRFSSRVGRGAVAAAQAVGRRAPAARRTARHPEAESGTRHHPDA